MEPQESNEHVECMLEMLDSLIPFANDHFDFFDDDDLDALGPEGSPEGIEAMGDLLELLWSSPDVIDTFVRRNPDGLSERNLRVVASWKDALRISCLYIGPENGYDLYLVGDRLVGVVQTEGHVPGPQLVTITFLPFKGCITEDFQSSFLPGMAKNLPFDFDELTNEARARGIITTADEFIAFSRDIKRQQSNKQMERLLDEAARESRLHAGEDISPEGFHRGPLAGLPFAEREKLIREKAECGMDSTGRYNPLKESASKAEPGRTLKDCLMSCNKTFVQHLARTAGMKKYSALRKDELVQRVADELLDGLGEDGSALGTLCGGLPSRIIAQIRDLVTGGNVLDLSEDEALAMRPYPLSHAPLTFLYRTDGGYRLVLPDDVRDDLARTFDFDAAIQRAQRTEHAMNAVDGALLAYGIIPFDDVFSELEMLDGKLPPLERLRDRIYAETAYSDSGMHLWLHEGVSYLVHWELMDAEIDLPSAFLDGGPIDAAINEALEHFGQEDLESQDEEALIERMSEFLSRRLRESITEERTWADKALDERESALLQERLYLLDCQKQTPRKHLYEFSKSGDVLEALMALPAADKLTTYLNERIPNGQTDYFFAETTVEGMILAVVTQNADAMELFNMACARGLDGCDENPQRLMGQLVNLRNSLPLWDLNGWSALEELELSTGRKLFMDDYGMPRKIGRNDPCPCGSGKKYKKCCGR